jgi:hypothetical protein
MARGLDWDVPPFEACHHTASAMPGILKRHAVQPEKCSVLPTPCRSHLDAVSVIGAQAGNNMLAASFSLFDPIQTFLARRHHLAKAFARASLVRTGPARERNKWRLLQHASRGVEFDWVNGGADKRRDAVHQKPNPFMTAVQERWRVLAA